MPIPFSTTFGTLPVEIGKNETWALERILEHALKNAVIPDILKKYPKEIIKLGEIKQQQLATEKSKTTSVASPKVLDRLPYYRKQDVELSMPIYKANFAFPLIILKRIPRAKNTPPGQQRLLVLDSDGDLAVTVLPLAQIKNAERKLDNLQQKGKEGYLICQQEPEGISVDVMEISKLQKQALEAVAQYFQENSKTKQPLSSAVKKVLSKARETALD